MSCITETWTRRNFDVEAVRVTEENIQSVATWCGGTVAKTLSDTPKLYIVLDATHYGRRHTIVKVFVGDWIIWIDNQFKHYRNESFNKAYQPKKSTEKQQAITEIVQQAILADTETSIYSFEELTKILTAKVMHAYGS